RASRSFSMSPMQGGVSVPQGSGSWYLIYPFAPAQRVLNAHLQSLVSLSLFNRAYPSETTQAMIDAGVAAVLPILPKFDTGAWSRYQFGQEANLNYHDFMTDLFKKLSKDPTFAGVPQFGAYYDKFAGYRVTPPNVFVPPGAWPTLIPPVDGFHDGVEVRYRVDKRSSDVVRITNPAGALVRSYSTGGGTGWHSITWNGATAFGLAVPAGTYDVQISTRDIVGNYRRGSLTQKIEVVRDTDTPVLKSLVTRSTGAKSTIVVVRALDVSSGYLDASITIGGIRVGAVRMLRGKAGVIKVSFAAARVRTGMLKLVDSSGNVTTVPVA
ncbi:MAG: hypothetical protein H7287_10410, partial [Thermoleophilia bacterium]|nr:hypothetical protein [Thermoleophilia bacterium]